jgi:hypothetical protein
MQFALKVVVKNVFFQKHNEGILGVKYAMDTISKLVCLPSIPTILNKTILIQ